MLLGLGVFLGNHYYILIIVHGIWFPIFLLFLDRKEIILFLVNEVMLSCLIWDDYLGVVILMPITILIGVGLAAYKYKFLIRN